MNTEPKTNINIAESIALHQKTTQGEWESSPYDEDGFDGWYVNAPSGDVAYGKTFVEEVIDG